MKASNKVRLEGGISSMTDLVFLLLIFFIIVASMVNESHSVDLPEGAGDPSEHSPLKVYITQEKNKNGEKIHKFYLNEFDSTYTSVKQIISKIEREKLIAPNTSTGKRNPEVILELLADKKADRKNAYDIINYAKANQLKVIIKTKGG